jgi:hypothetical protein
VLPVQGNPRRDEPPIIDAWQTDDGLPARLRHLPIVKLHLLIWARFEAY